MKFDIEILQKALFSNCDFHGKLHCENYILLKDLREFLQILVQFRFSCQILITFGIKSVRVKLLKFRTLKAIIYLHQR